MGFRGHLSPPLLSWQSQWQQHCHSGSLGTGGAFTPAFHQGQGMQLIPACVPPVTVALPACGEQGAWMNSSFADPAVRMYLKHTPAPVAQVLTICLCFGCSEDTSLCRFWTGVLKHGQDPHWL